MFIQSQVMMNPPISILKTVSQFGQQHTGIVFQQGQQGYDIFSFLMMMD
jgi:hypothetical protein